MTADPRLLTDAALQAELETLLAQAEASARRWACDRPDCDGMPHAGWRHRHARAAQRLPGWPWSTFTIMAARGGGKSRAASEAVRQWAAKPRQQIAVIARKESLCREVCFEHRKSGLLTVIPASDVRRYNPGTGQLKIRMMNGSTIFGFGAEVPDNIRGFEFDKGWGDEFAAWNRLTAQEMLDMLWFTLREAEDPQVIVTTTPKAVPHMRTLVKRAKEAERTDPDRPRVVLRSWPIEENLANLSAEALDELRGTYEGTRLGRQELGGVLLEDVDGALWKQWMLDTPEFRVHPQDVPPMQRKVLALDPAATSTETADRMAFVVAGRSWPFDVTFPDQRPRGYVFAAEQDRMTPAQAVHRAAKLYHQHECDAVVIEANNGGEWIPALFQAYEPTVVTRIAHATRDKRARATPVAALYEAGRVHHVGEPRRFDEFETQMTTYVGGPDATGEDSPDLLDAAVWALHDLFLDPGTSMGVETFGQRLDDLRLDGRR